MSIIKNVDLKFDNFEMKIKELTIPDQGVTAFSGPSGSGKTTLFNILVGIHQPKNWSWIFAKEDLAKLSIKDRNLGVVFQNYDLFPHMTAEENIRVVFEARNKNKNSFSEVIQKYVTQLKLERCWSTKAALLSGGEKQRVSLLRALISRPRVLLLDEPFSALDKNTKVEARSLVKDLLQNLQIPVYLITHDLADVQALADHVIYIEHGHFQNVKKLD